MQQVQRVDKGAGLVCSRFREWIRALDFVQQVQRVGKGIGPVQQVQRVDKGARLACNRFRVCIPHKVIGGVRMGIQLLMLLYYIKMTIACNGSPLHPSLK